MRRRGVSRWLVMGVALMVMGAGLASLAACGAGTPAVVGRSCGSVSKGYRVVGDPSGPEDCLWQAWMRCQSATLVYTNFGVDTGDTHTITVQPNSGGCEVRDATQGYSANGGGSRGLITTYTCAGLERSPDGGLIVHACGGEDDLTIPPAEPPTQAPTGPTPSPS